MTYRGRRSAVAGVLAGLAGLIVLPALPTAPTVGAWADRATASAAVTAGSWGTPPAGSAVVPADSATTVTNLAWTVMSVSQLCVAVTVSTTSTEPVEWHTRVAYDAGPFRGDAVMSHYVLESDNGWVERLDNTPSVGQIEFHGIQVTWSPRRKLSLRPDDEFPSSVVFTLCNRNLPPPVYDSSATYQVTVSAPPTNPNKACQDVTVGVTSATYPFYVGWRADVDLAPLLNLRRQAGLSTTVSIRSGGVQATLLHDDVYRMTSAADYTAGVRSAGPGDAAVTRAFTVCAG